ncbi:target of EGR1 protein 1-like [Montipora foliosa]|uniref:target of EGR1 protein 1-like n=1 Tax=Montipora foliosa TaxID=591990 RepID=UPI0035F18F50
MVARFDFVPVVEVSAANFSEVWPFMVRAINESSFVAVDTEMSGLGDRQKLAAQFVEDRYKHMCEMAKSRAILSLGISCFKLKKTKTKNNETEKKLKVRVRTYNIVVLSTENFVVEPSSLKFLVEHGFDFNKQYAKGVPYTRGSDEGGSDNPLPSVRNLFSELVLAGNPVVLHNGFLDLVFLYENFYNKLPEKLEVFTSDVSDMFPAGIFDTKFVAEYHAREPASFLLYLFKKSQRNNLQHEKSGEKHVSVKFSEDAPLHSFTEELYCETRGDNENVHTDVVVCETFAAYGFCRREKSCPLSHDVDDILDRERKVKEIKRQKRKRKHRTTSDSSDSKTKSECNNAATTNESNNSQSTSENGETLLTFDHVTQPDAAQSHQPSKKTRDCGHRAGFDAFMTGYCMATFFLQLGKRNDDNELVLSSLGEIANKLSLTKKDIPLQIARSHFARPSASHTEKIKRLKERRFQTKLLSN